jgi:hypothetical protein
MMTGCLIFMSFGRLGDQSRAKARPRSYPGKKHEGNRRELMAGDIVAPGDGKCKKKR